MNEREIGWLEGVIDGEGSIYLLKPPTKHLKRGYMWQPKLTIVNTDLRLINRAREIIRGLTPNMSSITASKILVDKRKIKLNPKWKPVYTLNISPHICRELLPQLKLTIKDEQRKLLIEALSLLRDRNKNESRMNEIHLAIKNLNHKGIWSSN